MYIYIYIYIYSRMHIYLDQMSPSQSKRRATEWDYTKAVSDITQCTFTLVRYISDVPRYVNIIYQNAHLPRSHVPHCKLNPELQSMTTPKQFPIQHNKIYIAEGTSTQVRHTPPQIEPGTTGPDYTKAVSDIAQCNVTLSLPIGKLTY